MLISGALEEIARRSGAEELQMLDVKNRRSKAKNLCRGSETIVHNNHEGATGFQQGTSGSCDAQRIRDVFHGLEARH